jgi:hypothetical protein
MTLTQIAIELRRSYGVEADHPVSPALGDEILFVDYAAGQPVIAIFEVRDSVAILPVVERYLTKDGAHVTTETYGGFDVMRSSRADGRAAAFVGRYLVLGTREQIVRAIDARAAGEAGASEVRDLVTANPRTVLATERRETAAPGELLLEISRVLRTTDGAPELLDRPDVHDALESLPPAVSHTELRDGGLYVESRSAVGGLSYLTSLLGE